MLSDTITDTQHELRLSKKKLAEPVESFAGEWYSVDPERVESRLETSMFTGLSKRRIGESRALYGKNEFAPYSNVSIYTKIRKQFNNPLALILVAACVATILLGEYLDAFVVFLALAINIAAGTIQEERASKAFEKLAESQTHSATVIRDGKQTVIPSSEIVVGDLVVLGAGMYVPADIRITKAHDLELNEAPLTGEWIEVEKTDTTLKGTLPLPLRTNMAWMGTLVAAGEGAGIVTAVGEHAQLGSIAQNLAEEGSATTPIQRSISRLARALSIAALGALLLIIFLGIVRGEAILDVVLLGIALAVSVVPEGLPAAVTIILAIGMERLLSRGGLVKNLLAAETLGSTTVIMTDKTGTLTEAKMSLVELVPYAGAVGEDVSHEESIDLLQIAVLASDAFVEDHSASLVVRGRPIERAIMTAGLEEGLSPQALRDLYERLDFLPFKSQTRFAAALCRGPQGKRVIYISGAPERLLKMARYFEVDGEMKELTDEARKAFEAAQSERSAEGKRLTAVAYVPTTSDKIDESAAEAGTFEGMVFAGFLVFEDPIRRDVPRAIVRAQEAGARVVMVTGDNAETALSIAIQAGIAQAGERVYTGSEVEEMSDDELIAALESHSVFARILPSQKLRIAEVLKNVDETVAMTGDGINDAPALRKADIGVAVGSGTEIAKEASDLVLIDNSFSIIVSAIEEGRRIIDNLKKIVVHSVSTSFGEVFLLMGALVFATPLPILPIQILWLNIVEGGLLNFAYAFEPANKEIMKRNPRSAEARDILSPKVLSLTGAIGTAAGIFTLLLFFLLQESGMPIAELRTVMFVVLSFDAIFFALSLKNFEQPIWKINIFSNPFLIGGLMTSFLLVFLAVYVGPMARMLDLVPLGVGDIFLVALVALFDLVVVEGAKYLLFEGPNLRQDKRVLQ